MQTHLDHLVVGASSLEAGVEYIKRELGVYIPFGGRHRQMGTHNHLMKLGDYVFLEVIAIDPEGVQPTRPRWFGLDDPSVQLRLAKEPSLLTWVVNTSDLEEALTAPSLFFGDVETLSRGELSWYFGLPDDGRLLAGGMLPYLMSWQAEQHPAKNMADVGCRLSGLRLFSPRVEWTRQQLSAIGASSLVEVKKLESNTPFYLEMDIDTPTGKKTLRS